MATTTKVAGDFSQVDHLRAFSIPEFAERFRVSRGSARLWIRQGRLRAVRLGDRVVVPLDEMIRVMKEGI